MKGCVLIMCVLLPGTLQRECSNIKRGPYSPCSFFFFYLTKQQCRMFRFLFWILFTFTSIFGFLELPENVKTLTYINLTSKTFKKQLFLKSIVWIHGFSLLF